MAGLEGIYGEADVGSLSFGILDGSVIHSLWRELALAFPSYMHGYKRPSMT